MLSISNQVAAQGVNIDSSAYSCIVERAVAAAAAVACQSCSGSGSKLLNKCVDALQQLSSIELPAAVWDELWKLRQQQEQQQQQQEGCCSDATMLLPLGQLLALLKAAPAGALPAVLGSTTCGVAAPSAAAPSAAAPSAASSAAGREAAAGAVAGMQRSLLGVLFEVMRLLSQLQLRRLSGHEKPVELHQQQAAQQQQQQQSLHCRDLERQQAVDELAPAFNFALTAGLACIAGSQAALDLLVQLTAAIRAVLRVLLLPDDQLELVLQLVSGVEAADGSSSSLEYAGSEDAMNGQDCRGSCSNSSCAGLVGQAAELVGRASMAMKGAAQATAAAVVCGDGAAVGQGSGLLGCGAVAAECAWLVELCGATLASLS
jgi:hypothetical protein